MNVVSIPCALPDAVIAPSMYREAGWGRDRIDMGTFRKLAIVALIHMSFTVAAYGTGLFGLHLPHGVTIALWLAVPSLLALAIYVWILSSSPLFAGESDRSLKLGLCAFGATLVSLYFGVFIAYDTFGS